MQEARAAVDAGGLDDLLCLALAARQRDREAFEHVDLAAQVVGKAHDEVEAAVALKDQPRLAASHRHRDHVLHVRDVEAIAGQGRAVRLHRHDGQALGLLDFGIGSAGDRLQRGQHTRGGLLHGREVIAVHLDRHVAAHAGDQLVEAHLDRLRELVVLTRLGC